MNSTIDVNDVVCIEYRVGDQSVVHFVGGRYILVDQQVARQMQETISDRLIKVMSVFGEIPTANPGAKL